MRPSCWLRGFSLGSQRVDLWLYSGCSPAQASSPLHTGCRSCHARSADGALRRPVLSADAVAGAYPLPQDASCLLHLSKSPPHHDGGPGTPHPPLGCVGFAHTNGAVAILPVSASQRVALDLCNAPQHSQYLSCVRVHTALGPSWSRHGLMLHRLGSRFSSSSLSRFSASGKPAETCAQVGLGRGLPRYSGHACGHWNLPS